MKHLLLIVLVSLASSACAINKYVFHNKSDWNLSAQIEDVIDQQTRGRGFGRIPKDFVVQDGDAAKATPLHYQNQSAYRFSRLDGDRLCFSYRNEMSPDDGPEQDMEALKSWIYAVGAYASLGDLGHDAPWPKPAANAMDSFAVTRNEVIQKKHEGITQPRRMIELEMCGPKPAGLSEASYLALFVLNNRKEWDSDSNMERYVLLWDITDSTDADAATIAAHNLAALRGPRSAPGTAATPATTTTTPSTSSDSPTPNTATGANGVLATLAAKGNFTTLLKLINKAGLESKLNGPGPFTVFAPTDDAFANLAKGDLDRLSDKEWLTTVLSFHIAPAAYPSAKLKGPMMLKMLEGLNRQFQRVGGQLTIGGANVRSEVTVSNGVLYAIDKVMTP